MEVMNCLMEAFKGLMWFFKDEPEQAEHTTQPTNPGDMDAITNLFGFGSNSGRLYTHTDLKLLKNGGGSHAK